MGEAADELAKVRRLPGCRMTVGTAFPYATLFDNATRRFI